MKIEKINPIYLIKSYETNELISYNSIIDALTNFYSNSTINEQIVYSNLSMPSVKDNLFSKDSIVKLEFRCNNKKNTLYFKMNDDFISFTNKGFSATTISRDYARKLVIYFDFILGSLSPNIKFSICNKDDYSIKVPKYDDYVHSLNGENEKLKKSEEYKEKELQKNQVLLNEYKYKNEQQNEEINKLKELYDGLNEKCNELKNENFKLKNNDESKNIEDLKNKVELLKKRYQKFYCDKECDECKVMNKIYDFYKCDFSNFKEINCESLSLGEKNNWFPYNKIEHNFNYIQRYQDYYDNANYHFFEKISKRLIKNNFEKKFKIAIIGGGNGSELFALNEVAKDYSIEFECTFVDKVIWPANYFHEEYSNISSLTIKKMDYNLFIIEKNKFDVVIFNRVINYTDLPENVKRTGSLKEKYLIDLFDKIKKMDSTYIYLIQVISKRSDYNQTDMVEDIVYNELPDSLEDVYKDEHFIHKIYYIK